MSGFSPASPVTGGTVTGLTSPTYTLTVDNVPVNLTGKAWCVTALGGTQTGVTTHSVSSPFSIMCTRPATPKLLGVPNPATGVISSVPTNRTAITVRKGVTPASGQPAKPLIVRIEVDCPAGAETYDAVNVAAAISLATGAFWAEADDSFTTVKTGIVG